MIRPVTNFLNHSRTWLRKEISLTPAKTIKAVDSLSPEQKVLISTIFLDLNSTNSGGAVLFIYYYYFGILLLHLLSKTTSKCSEFAKIQFNRVKSPPRKSVEECVKENIALLREEIQDLEEKTDKLKKFISERPDLKALFDRHYNEHTPFHKKSKLKIEPVFEDDGVIAVHKKLQIKKLALEQDLEDIMYYLQCYKDLWISFVDHVRTMSTKNRNGAFDFPLKEDFLIEGPSEARFEKL